MAKLASCHDHFIRETAFKAKIDLQRSAAKHVILPISPPQQGLSHMAVISPRTPTSPPSFQVPSPYWDPHSAGNTNPEFMAMNYLDSMSELQKQAQLLGLENHIDANETGGIGHDYFGIDASAANFSVKGGRRLSNLSEFPVKTCHYFNKGFCKHGTSCRYYHGQLVPENFSQMHGSDSGNEEQLFSPGSLEQLESEIVEILKTRRGSPLSIASLPMVYYDKYKKVLQADGYLTESQRHGKSGYSLTKLLARLKRLCLIDRPHGQHAVVLAEDAPKYMQKGEYGQNISASRQIYLTFPAESTFTEDDVSSYFNTYGCVEDVRIPCQQRRMFGFVTFVDPETVKTILAKGNPHYVCGSRVLVKPYREKAKVVDRKFPDRIEHQIYISPPHYVDMDSEFPLISRSCGNHRFLARQLIGDEEQNFLQRRRLAELQFAQKSWPATPQLSFSMDGLRVSDEDASNFQPAEPFIYALNEKPNHTDTSLSDENSSQGLNLPDSPFAFPIENGI
ncbi:hypothetical protein RIF29_18070 [Crotalaria pallida]|uniref:Zinc finger CCCH domain-containing protein 18-like n=1 Tax=Crotalaria pallida TaxID=3830 RepID=A0AAN9FKK6_CROPI